MKKILNIWFVLTLMLTYNVSAAEVSLNQEEISVMNQLKKLQTQYGHKRYEEVDKNRIKALQKSIDGLASESEIKKEAYRRLTDVVMETMFNSLTYWKKFKVKYFKEYCMTKTFQDTMRQIVALKLDVDTLYDRYQINAFSQSDTKFIISGISEALFDVILKHVKNAVQAWDHISPGCDGKVEDYVTCSDKFLGFIELIDMGIQEGRLNIYKYKLAEKTQQSVVIGAQVAMEESLCKCAQEFRSTLKKHYLPKQAAVVVKIDSFLQKKCKKGCPYLWGITFKQSGTIDTNRCFGSGLTNGDEISQVDGYAYFPNVLIRPSEAYELTWKEDDLCEPYRKNDIQNNYSAKSKGDTYQKIDGFDGIDADVVRLRVLNIHKGQKKMIFEYGSVLMSRVLEKISSFERPEDRSTFMLTDTCGQSYTFDPVPIYGKH